MVLAIIAVGLTAVSTAAQFRFDDYQVYKIKVETKAQLLALQKLENGDAFEGGFDFWKAPVLGGEAELMVPPFEVQRFKSMISMHRMRSTLKIEDVQRCVCSKS